MHELSITQNILKIALDHARQANAERILSIQLVTGELASVVDECVQFYWDMIAEGTIAEGSELRFERVRTKMRCRDCDLTYHPTPDALACPKCSGVNVEVQSGKEFYMKSIEVEEPGQREKERKSP